jgi:hypothetical protein
MAKVEQYRLTVKFGGKLITGLETTGLKLTPIFEDILLKANSGVVSKEFEDYDMSMSISGKTYGKEATEENFESLRHACALGTQGAFIYGRFTQGAQQVSGYAVIKDWGEDAGSEKKAGNWSGTLEAIRGAITFGTQA